jgi:hypothetical protein
MYKGLPEFCFGTDPITNEVILIKRGEQGYYRYYNGTLKGKEKARELNEQLGVTIAQAEAMFVGSMFGWHVPGANPDRYNEDGTFNAELPDKEGICP